MLDRQGELKEELCSLTLPCRATGSKVFNARNEMCGICTGGATSTTGHRSGVVAEMKDVGHPDI
ncbi:unnamed protein product [Soboliphyme baturini]|uniref:Uncharacterized protein n=1 Tax=Soboliphyme baturini TaxID=241478 RepID=A0A183IA46_9BILA|nr:unnamed protein product [Soboliphyme baturini]